MGFFDGIGGAIISGVGSLLGGLSTNSANASLASENRQFQADMSGSAHQREVEDLRKAGLNPILSANGGASTPSGSVATMQNFIGEAARSFTSTAMQAQRQESEIEQMKASTAKTLQDANQSSALTQLIRNQNLNEIIRTQVLQTGIRETEARTSNIASETMLNHLREGLIQSQASSAASTAAIDKVTSDFLTGSEAGRTLMKTGITAKELNPMLGAVSTAKSISGF